MGSRSKFDSSASFQTEHVTQDHVQPPKTIKDRIRKLYEQQLYYDVKILVRGKAGRGNRERTFLAHKAILAIGSEVLAKLIYGSKDVKNSSSDLIIADVDCIAFKNLICFLYTDEVCFENAAEVLETYAVAEKYAVPRLKQECAISLASTEISSDTVCQILEISASMKFLEMKQKCLKFIEDNTEDVFRSPSFEKATTGTVKTILKLQRLSVRSEIDVFRAVLSRVKKEHFGTTVIDSWDSVRLLIQPFLKHIHFLSMSVEEFSYCLSHFKGLFSESEALSIIMEISKPGASNLPDWVNKGRSRFFQQQTPRNNHDMQRLLICFGLTDTQGSGYSTINSLTSIVEITCRPQSHGSYVLKGIKLQWKQRRYAQILQYRLKYVISVQIIPSGFNFREKVRIVQQGEEDAFYFTKSAYFGPGDKAKIKVEATEISGLEFLVPDHSKMYNNMKGASFQFELDSSESDNRFLISEIYFELRKGMMGDHNKQKFSKKFVSHSANFA